ncbi:MAG: [NiFe]-hydrogenase assembly chaperone HybE [Proteobacteria bacterium]|nr:[NiFe]-hydrogenase assembly chaperone HybE [Pseudomonadota bacterium]
MSGLATFEGSYGGNAQRIADDTRLECKICWYVYDPAKGCESWQIPGGTPFTALPRDWRCPGCDAPPSGFMALDVTPVAGPAPVAVMPAAPVKMEDINLSIRQKEARALAEKFEEAFRELHRGRMRDVPFLNSALQVQAIGFRPYDHEVAGRCTLGVLLTPWFMNIVLVPDEAPEPAPQVGSKSVLSFPSGRYEFVWNNREETGPYRACSLFSPVNELASQLQAVEIGVEVLKALFQEEHREEGARTSEIRALREEEIRRQEEAEAAKAAAEAAAAEAAARPADPEAATPSRRALFVPRARKSEPEPEAPSDEEAAG